MKARKRGERQAIEKMPVFDERKLKKKLFNKQERLGIVIKACW